MDDTNAVKEVAKGKVLENIAFPPGGAQRAVDLLVDMGHVVCERCFVACTDYAPSHWLTSGVMSWRKKSRARIGGLIGGSLREKSVSHSSKLRLGGWENIQQELFVGGHDSSHTLIRVIHIWSIWLFSPFPHS